VCGGGGKGGQNVKLTVTSNLMLCQEDALFVCHIE